MSRWTAPLLVAATFVTLISIGVWQASKHLPNPREWASLLESELTKTLATPVKIGSAEVGLTKAILHDLQIQPDHRSPTGYVLVVPRIQIRWSLKQILRPFQWKQFVQAQFEQALHQIVIANATLFLWRDRTGRWNVQPFLAQRPSRRAVKVPSLQIRDGTLVLGDETLPLPNGMPFRLKLVSVQATVQPVEFGTRVEAQGKIASPLGTESSQAILTIIQTGDETGQGIHGRLIAEGIRIAYLPKQLQSFSDFKVRLTDGMISRLVFNWHQNGSETQLSGNAALKDAIFNFQGVKDVKLSPLQVGLGFHIHSARQRILSWQFTARTLQTHSQFGDSAFAAEGLRNLWRVRWRGKGFAVNTIQLLTTEPLPFQGGKLSGEVTVEGKLRRLRVHADLSVTQTFLRPTEELTKFQVPTVSVSLPSVKASLERRGNFLTGRVDIFARSGASRAKVRVWLNGKEGRAWAQVDNLGLATYKKAILNLLPNQLRPHIRLHGGTLSGAVEVSWVGRRFKLERLNGQIRQVSVVGDGFQSSNLTAHFRSDGKTFQVTRIQTYLDRDSLAFFSGQTTIARTPIWYVQGQISPRAMSRLTSWAISRLNLPLHLLSGGKSQINAGGAGTQWQAQITWNDPSFLAKLQNIRWQTKLGRLTIFAAPEGAVALINEAYARPSQVRIPTNGSALQLSNGIRVSELRLVWDEKRRLLVAYGSVNIPKLEIEGFSLEDGTANLEIALEPSDKPSIEVKATSISAKFLRGMLSDGQALLVSGGNNEATIKAYAHLKNCDISEIIRQLRERNENVPFVEGKFTGRLSLNAQVPSPLKLTFSGDFSDLKAKGDEWQAKAQNLHLTGLTVFSAHDEKGWSLKQISADGSGRNIRLSQGEREVQVERTQVQTFAKRTDDGWSWDLRLPNAKVLDGTVSGQATITPLHANGHISFSNLDISQMAKLVGLSNDGKSPRGKSSGWLRFTASKEDGKWSGDWEGASLLTDASWNDWSVKIAGVRVSGDWLADEKMDLQQAKGKVEGIHLLSDDGQAVLSGTFSLRQGSAIMALEGRWTGISLRRLSQRFDLPVKLQGLAEGTLEILWDGKWQVRGNAQSQAVRVGESAIWNDVFGEWIWSGNLVQLERVRAEWNGGRLMAEGYFGITNDAPSNLTVHVENIALTDLSVLLRELKLPLSDWHWYGLADGKVWVSWTKGQLNFSVSLDAEQVRLGLAQLGEVRLDLTFTRNLRERKTQTSTLGTLNIKHNGMVVTAELSGSDLNWQIRWRGGNIPISTLRLVASDWSQRLEKDAKTTVDRWLSLPLTGEIWTEGTAVIVDGQIAEARAKFVSPNLRGIGETATQTAMVVQRNGKAWLVNLEELRHGHAKATGSLALADEGTLSGSFELSQVPPKLVTGMLNLLGAKLEFDQLPDGALSAQLKIRGTKERPVVEGMVRADGIFWKGWTVRQILIRRFEFRDGTIRVDKGDGIVRWRADASLASFWGWSNLNGKKQMFWQLELPPTPIDAILPPDLPLQIDSGWLSGSISLQGSLAEPKLKGSVEVRADKVSFAEQSSLPKPFEDLTTIRNVRIQFEADGRTAKLTQFVASLGTGTVTGHGWLELGEDGLKNLFANKGELTFRAENLRTKLGDTNLNLRTVSLKSELSKSGLRLLVEGLQGDGLSMQGDVVWERIPKERWMWLSNGKWNLTLKLNEFKWQVDQAKGELSGFLALRSQGENSPPVLQGNVEIHDGDIWRLPVAGTGEAQEWNLPPALQFAVRLAIGDRFFLRNPQASIVLGGELSLIGDLSRPGVDGELRSRRGTLRLPATVLTITDMSVRAVYAVDPLTRQWVGTARLRVEGETQLDIHRILFAVSGPVDAQSQRLGILPSVTLLAIPPLPEQTALERMFGLGLAQLGDVLTNWQQLFSGTLVQSFMGNLLAPVTEPIAQALKWTELSVVREQKTGRQWLRLGIPLAPRLHVLWRQGFSTADPSALEVQYYLGKRTSVTIIKRERERAEFRIQTSVRF